MSEVKLPRSVRKQIAEAEQIEKDMAAAANAVPGTTSLDQLGVQPPAPAPAPVQPPAPAPAPVDNPPVPAQPDLASQLAAAEQRYRTLQGMMSSEVGTLRSQVKDSQVAIQQLNEQLKAREAQPQSAVLDPKDVEAFGADLVDMVRRQASAEIEAAVKAHVGNIVSRLETLEGTLKVTGQNVAATAEQQFYESLTRRVSDWRAVNADQKFLEWLGGVDEVYGVPRQAALDNAVNTGSVDRTAAIFEAFKKTAAPAPAPANDLSLQVTPTRSGGGSAAPQPVEVQTVSTADITKFYDDVRRGVYRGKDAEFQRLETQINLAIAEGRVR